MDEQQSLEKDWCNKRTYWTNKIVLKKTGVTKTYWTNNIVLKKTGRTSGLREETEGGPKEDEIWSGRGPDNMKSKSWKRCGELILMNRIVQHISAPGVRLVGGGGLKCKTTQRWKGNSTLFGNSKVRCMEGFGVWSIGRYGYAPRHQS